MNLRQRVGSAGVASVKGDAMLLSAPLIFGVNISVIALMLRWFDPLTLSVLRTGLGAVMLAALTLATEGTLAVRRRDLPMLLGLGAVVFLDQVSFSYSLTIVNSAILSLLFAATPLSVMLLTALVRRRSLSARHWLATAIGFTGVALIVAYGQRLSSHSLLGDLEGLGASVGTAAFTMLLLPLSRRYSAAKVLAYAFAASALGGAAAGAGQLIHEQWAGIPWQGWAECAGSVAGSVVAGNALYVLGIKILGPIRASMHTYLEPGFGVVAAWVLLAVRLSLIEIGGGCIVIISLAIEPSRSGAIEPT
jgi:drug/metabolite transporter (DMT)-like permease